MTNTSPFPFIDSVIEDDTLNARAREDCRRIDKMSGAWGDAAGCVHQEGDGNLVKRVRDLLALYHRALSAPSTKREGDAPEDERSGWLPIETAPKDDAEFQALGCHKTSDGDWAYYIINRHDIGGRYESWVVPPGRPIHPTHYQPLPLPPSADTKTGTPSDAETRMPPSSSPDALPVSRNDVLEEAAKECSHRAFLCHTHDALGKARERGMLDCMEYIRALKSDAPAPPGTPPDTGGK